MQLSPPLVLSLTRHHMQKNWKFSQISVLWNGKRECTIITRILHKSPIRGTRPLLTAQDLTWTAVE